MKTDIEVAAAQQLQCISVMRPSLSRLIPISQNLFVQRGYGFFYLHSFQLKTGGTAGLRICYATLQRNIYSIAYSAVSDLQCIVRSSKLNMNLLTWDEGKQPSLKKHLYCETFAFKLVDFEC